MPSSFTTPACSARRLSSSFALAATSSSLARGADRAASRRERETAAGVSQLKVERSRASREQVRRWRADKFAILPDEFEIFL